MSDLREQLVVAAQLDFPNEACGLVVAQTSGKWRLVRANNMAFEPRITFDLDPDAWLEVQDDEEVIGIYHSHPSGIAEPSLADLSACEASGLPWHIVGYQTGDYRAFQPSGFRAPYLKRPYVFGVHDCYGIVRDWYLWEWDIELPDVIRRDLFWKNGQDLFMDNFQHCGFQNVGDVPIEVGDLFILQVKSDLPNHMMLYIGDGVVLHHASGRLSSREVWGGFWAKHSLLHLRHNSRLGHTNG